MRQHQRVRSEERAGRVVTVTSGELSEASDSYGSGGSGLTDETFSDAEEEDYSDDGLIALLDSEDGSLPGSEDGSLSGSEDEVPDCSPQ